MALADRRGGQGGQEGQIWASKMDFFMVAISWTIGFSNLWRFPYLCYKSGGAVFLVAYILFNVLVGFPIVTLELALGQYGRWGPLEVWNACPIFKGVGLTMVIINFISISYYMVLIAYSIFYACASFTSTFPWSTCDNFWNTEACIADATSGTANFSSPDHVVYRASASSEYFDRYVLQMSSGIDDLGVIRWQLALCLLFAWVLVVVGLSCGIRSWGKVAWVTAILPYLVLLAMLFMSSARPGTAEGFAFFMTPAWSYLHRREVWYHAASQMFFSLGCGYGSFVTMGKHNKFHDNPVLAAMTLVGANILTSLLCGFVVFGIFGQIAYENNIPITSVATSGTDLVFSAIPRGLQTWPGAPVWSVLFFVMLMSLGVGSAMPQVANIVVSVTEAFTKLQTLLGRLAVLIVVSVFIFLISLVYITQGGLYIFTLVDTYGTVLALMFIVLFEAIAFGWFYALSEAKGLGRLVNDLCVMTGWRWNHFFVVAWMVFIPAAMLFLIVMFFLSLWPLQLGYYVYPAWCTGLGWIITAVGLTPIPVYIIFRLITHNKSFWLLIRPTPDWGYESDHPPPDYVSPTIDTKDTEI